MKLCRWSESLNSKQQVMSESAEGDEEVVTRDEVGEARVEILTLSFGGESPDLGG